jgi:hypothetical protein
MKKAVLILFCAFILFSCEKEKQLIPENTGIPLLSKILIDGVSYCEYTYNDANLPVEEKSKLQYTRHNYNDNNLLSSSDFYIDPALYSSSSSIVEASFNREEWVNPVNTAKSLTQKFGYDRTGQLSRKTYIRPSVTSSEYSEFTFVNERISRQSIYWKDEMTVYIDYSYDERGNLIKESKYQAASAGIPELLTTTEYEYDSMHNPYKAFKRLMSPGKFTNPNNIIRETYTIHFEVDQWSQKVQVFNNTYEYNDKGYPVRVNGDAEYIYK